MAIGNVQLKRYFTSPAGVPTVTSGQISTSRCCRVRSSKRSTVPPRLPNPVPVAQMMLLSTGSGIAKPLSPPATAVPLAARNRAGVRVFGLLRDAAVARAARRRAVLSIAVHVVGNLVVGRDVIHLRDGQLNLVPAAAAIHREAQAVVVRDDHAIAVGRIDPHVVIVALRREPADQIDRRLAAVDRLAELGGEKPRLVLVVGFDGEARVVMRAAAELAVAAHQFPVLAAVVAAPERPALRRLPVVRRQAVAGLDQRVDAVRIAARDLRRDFADRRVRQAVAGQPLPGRRRRRST